VAVAAARGVSVGADVAVGSSVGGLGLGREHASKLAKTNSVNSRCNVLLLMNHSSDLSLA
jgi:hypothetical protein